MSASKSDKGDWRKGHKKRGPQTKKWRASSKSDKKLHESVPLRVLRIGFAFAAVGVAGLIAWLLLIPDGVQHPRFVVAVIGSYTDDAIPPNGRARQDLTTFQDLEKAGWGEDFAVEDWSDALTADHLLGDVKEKLANMQGQNVIMFCSMHAIVTPGGNVELYGSGATADSPHEGDTSRMVQLSSLLDALQGTGADQALLLLDAGRLPANWRMGVLANDVESQIRSLLEKKERPNVRVLCSAGPNEVSWTSGHLGEEGSVSGSVFGFYTVAGLKGSADGWGKEGKNQIEPDSRIKTDELYWYLKAKVDDWSQANRGVSQTVTSLGSSKSVDLASVTDSTEAEEETAPTTDGTSESEEGSKEKKGKKKRKPATPEELWEKLDGLWAERDKLRDHDPQEIAPYENTPHAWRALQSQLVLAVQQLRGGIETKFVEKTLGEAARLLKKVGESRGLPVAGADGVASSGPTLGFEKLFPPTVLDEKLKATLEELSLALLDAGKNLVKAKPETAQEAMSEVQTARDHLQEFLHKNPAAERELARSVFNKLTGDCSQITLSDQRPLLNAMDPQGWPAELILVERFVSLAEEFPKSDSEWPLRELCERALKKRRIGEELGAVDPNVFPLIERDLQQGLRALTAFERWLIEFRGQQPKVDDWRVRWSDAVDVHFGNVQDRQIAVLRAIRLRQKLLAELPDYAHWLAARGERDANIDWKPLLKSKKTSADISKAAKLVLKRDAGKLESLLLELMVQTRELGRLLETDVGNEEQREDWFSDLDRQVTNTEDSWDGFSEQFRREFSDVVERAGSDWRAVDAMIQLPWIKSGQMKRLRTLLDAKSGGGFSSPPKSSVAQIGVTQGFWAIQTLGLAGLDADREEALIAGWFALIDAAEEAGENILARARLGETINETWRNISDEHQPQDRQSPARREHLSRVVHGTDRQLDADDDPILARRQDQLQALLSFHSSRWNARTNHFDAHRVYSSLIEQSEDLLEKMGRELAVGGKPAAVARMTFQSEDLASGSTVLFGIDRIARLKVVVEGASTDGKAPQLSVYLFAPKTIVRKEGRAIDAPVRIQNSADEFELELESGDDSPRSLTVVLMHSADNFPVEIRTLSLEPPLDPTRWRITFRTKKDDKELDVERAGVRLRLPPTGKVELTAFLERPPDDTTASVNIRLLGTNLKGQDVELSKLDKVVLAPEGKPTPLVFESANATKKDPLDVSRGLTFEIELERSTGKKETTVLRFPILWTFWTASSFIELPEPPTIDQSQIVLRMASLKRPTPDSDTMVPLLPDSIPVKLHLPPALEARSPEKTLGAELGYEDEIRLDATFDFQTVAEWLKFCRNHDLRISLSVAGIPHAYQWDIDDQGRLKPVKKTEVRVAQPLHETIVKLDEKAEEQQIGLTLEINAPALDTPNQLWDLQYRFVRIGKTETKFGWISWPHKIDASVLKRVQLTELKAGKWKLSTSAADYVTQWSVNDRLGRFQVEVQLLNKGDLEATETRAVVIAIDDMKKPTVTGVTFDKNAKNDKPLSVTVTAEDRQSGIKKIVFGFDLNSNGRFDENDETIGKAATFGPFENPNATGSFTIDKEKLKGKTGKYQLFALVTNGVDQVSEVSSPFVVLEPPKAAGNGKPSTKPKFGTLIVKTGRDRINSITIKGPKPDSMEFPGARKTTEVKFTELPEGTYNIMIKGFKKQGKATAKVKAGETKTVTITLK